jgi:hypothetical protein
MNAIAMKTDGEKCVKKYLPKRYALGRYFRAGWRGLSACGRPQ